MTKKSTIHLSVKQRAATGNPIKRTAFGYYSRPTISIMNVEASLQRFKTASSWLTMSKPVILIVDDDAILLESIADLLLLSDFRVITASNGSEALQILKHERPDCIVSDVMMPKVDGYSLLQTIRSHEQWHSIPVILVTAYDKPFSRMDPGHAKPNAVLPKPFDVDQLINVIRENVS